MGMSRKALVVLSNGSEEMETVISTSLMRRAGIEVTIAGLTGPEPVKCTRGVVITPETSLDSVLNQIFDAIVLPGGLAGPQSLTSDVRVGRILKQHYDSNKLIAAICRAPWALKSHGIGLGKRITSHPTIADDLKNDFVYCEEEVVVDDQLITNRGPGTAFAWSVAIVTNLVGSEIMKEISIPMSLNLGKI